MYIHSFPDHIPFECLSSAHESRMGLRLVHGIHPDDPLPPVWQRSLDHLQTPIEVLRRLHLEQAGREKQVHY